jgi:hypothetical protein
MCRRISQIELLHILAKHKNELPLDARTIIGTPCQTLPLIDVAPVHYFYKGIISTIKQRLEILQSRGMPDKFPSKMRCLANKDGVPIAT